MKVWIARLIGALDGRRGALDVVLVRAGEAGNDRALDSLGDHPDRLEVAGRRRRESGFDDVDSELNEGVGHFELLFDGHRRARRLLAIAQRGVEDPNPVPYVHSPNWTSPNSFLPIWR